MQRYDRVLHSEEILEKTNTYQQARIQAIQKLMQSTIFVEPKQKFKAVKDDPDDDKFIDCAVEGKCDYIISQDKHLLKIKEFQGIRILTPKEFLKRLI